MQNLIEQEVCEIVEANRNVVVSNADDLGRATACVKGIKGLMQRVKATFDPIVDKAHKTHKEAVAQRKKHLDPLEAIETKFKDAIVTYGQKLEAEQRERERLANEALAKAAAEAKKNLEDKASSTDNEWESEVLQEKAQAIVPVTVDVQKKVIEQEGLSIRKTWKARVIDAVQVPRQYLIVNETLLNTLAKNETARKDGIPGVEFYQESSASVRT